MNRKAIQARFHWLGYPEFWAIVLIAALTLSLSIDWKWARGPDEWRWQRYLLPGIDDRLWVPLLTCSITGLLGYWMSVSKRANERASRWRQLTFLIFLVVAAVLVQFSVLLLENPQPLITMFFRTVSASSGGYFNVAADMNNVGDWLRHFPELMPTFKALHPQTHPPGLLLLFWGTAQLLKQWPVLSEPLGMALRFYVCNDLTLMPLSNATLGSAIAQMSTPIWGALTVLPLYGLARRLYGTLAAQRGAVLIIFVPSLVLWATRWDQAYMLIAALGLYIVHVGLEDRHWWLFLLAGILVSMATFLSLGNLAIGVMLIVYAGMYWLVASLSRPSSAAKNLHAISIRALLAYLIVFTLGAASVWVLYGAAYGVSFFDIFREGMGVHGNLQRTYSLWLGYDLYDFFLFLGIPITLAVFQMLWRLFTTRPWRARFTRSSIAFWTFGVTLVALDVSGSVRGEVARLWMFFVPGAVLASLPVVADWTQRRFAVMLALLIVQLMVCGYFLRPVVSGYPIYTPRPVQTAAPPMSQLLDAHFSPDNGPVLLGYELDNTHLHPGDPLHLTLYWQTPQRLAYPYTVFVHLLDEAGQIRAQADSMPQAGELPTTCWQAGEVVRDEHLISLDPTLQPGTYSINVGLYRLDLFNAGDPNNRLPVRQAGQLADHVALQSMQIEPQPR